MPVSKLRMNARTFLGAAFACALGFGAVIAWAPPALAGDDDDVAPDIKVLHSILESIGLRPSEKYIDYHERSPLVIPPSSTLPPPETDAAASNPNWPVDPEIKRAKAARAAERNKAAGESSEDFDTFSRPLSAAEMTKGPHKKSARDAGGTNIDDAARPLSQSELGYKGGILGNMFGKDEEKPAKFTSEPPRASLTDPPAGYQTPSPNEPYGNTKEKYTPKADSNQYNNLGTTIPK